jgi:hypothetical protein
MTFVSDRLVSINKIIIAAAVIYTGAVSFAHARPLSPQEIEFERCLNVAAHQGVVDHIDIYGTFVYTAPNYLADLTACRAAYKAAVSAALP